MPFDNTPYFKARAKLLYAKIGQTSEHIGTTNELFGESSYRQHSLSLKQLAKLIFEFKLLIRAKQPGYLSFNSPFTTTTDKERDKFDIDSAKALKHMETLSNSLMAEIDNDSELAKFPQADEHLRRVIYNLQKFLQALTNTLSSMKKTRLLHIRNRRTLGNLRGLTRLAQSKGIVIEQTSKHSAEPSPFGSVENDLMDTTAGEDDMPRTIDDTAIRNSTTTTSSIIPVNSFNDHSPKLRRRKAPSGLDSFDDNEPALRAESEELNDKELVQLQMENRQLYTKFSQTNMEIDKLETQIGEIQHLQSTFAEKLLDQEKDIEHVHNIAVRITEDLMDGNEWIREAISDSASRRVIVLFCIIVITFALLFIDWYNP